jgi:hypothetical protein
MDLHPKGKRAVLLRLVKIAYVKPLVLSQAAVRALRECRALQLRRNPPCVNADAAADHRSKPMPRGLRWDEVAPAFQWDGTWRDIYVLRTSSQTWAAFLACLKSWDYDIRYSEGGTEAPLPEAFEAPSRSWESAAPLLVIRSAGVEFNCHFFSEDEIELDLDPRQVHGQEQLDALVLFMERIGRCVKQEVRLTAENGPDTVPYLAYEPASDAWVKQV